MKNFNADQQTEELLSAEITIGGRVFHPTLVTPDVRREQMEIQHRNAKLARENGLTSDEEPTDDQLDERVNTFSTLDLANYSQVALLIVDENGQHPTEEFLTSKLDRRIMQKLLASLNDDADEEADSPGEAKPETATGA